jgi:hypothetical protein
MSVCNLSFSAVPQTSQTGTGALAGATFAPPINLTSNLQNGTATDNINLLSLKQFTFVASTPQTQDLTALTDPFGATITLARIRFIIFQMLGQTDGSSLTIGAAGSNPWSSILGSTGTYLLLPASATNPNGGFWIASAPNVTAYPVASGNKNVLMTPSAHAFSVNLYVFGNTA